MYNQSIDDIPFLALYCIMMYVRYLALFPQSIYFNGLSMANKGESSSLKYKSP